LLEPAVLTPQSRLEVARNLAVQTQETGRPQAAVENSPVFQLISLRKIVAEGGRIAVTVIARRIMVADHGQDHLAGQKRASLVEKCPPFSRTVVPRQISGRDDKIDIGMVAAHRFQDGLGLAFAIVLRISEKQERKLAAVLFQSAEAIPFRKVAGVISDPVLILRIGGEPGKRKAVDLRTLVGFDTQRRFSRPPDFQPGATFAA